MQSVTASRKRLWVVNGTLSSQIKLQKFLTRIFLSGVICIWNNPHARDSGARHAAAVCTVAQHDRCGWVAQEPKPLLEGQFSPSHPSPGITDQKLPQVHIT